MKEDPERYGRFSRHCGLLTLEEQQRISKTTVSIGGLGGIGGAVAMLCAKAGFGHLIICDRDQYELANVVEQMFATIDTVGHDKTVAAASEIRRHNPACRITPIKLDIRTEADAESIMNGADIVVSAVDNPFTRILLGRAAEKVSLPFIVSANLGWSIFYQAKFPGEDLYESRYTKLPGVQFKNNILDLDDPCTRDIVQVDWDIWLYLLGGFSNEFNTMLLRGGAVFYPYMAPPAFYAASFTANELIKLYMSIHGKHLSSDYYIFNLKSCCFLDSDILDSKARYLLNIYMECGRDSLIKYCCSPFKL